MTPTSPSWADVEKFLGVDGWRQIPAGEHTPSLERLVRVASGLDIELMIDIRPEKKKAQLPKKRALDAGSFAVGGCEVVLATA